MKIVCLSDTHQHGRDLKVPDGDVLVHCGDLTYGGSMREVEYELDWLHGLPHKHKIFIAGNHDFYFESSDHTVLKQYPELTYLQDSGVEINGVKFWGSPWTTEFMNWAFQLKTPYHAREHWARIPNDLDILITHGPPHGIGDTVPSGEMVGDGPMFAAILQVKPKHHLCGHIHGGYGERFFNGIHFVNCAVNNERYMIANPPVVFECS